MPFLTARSDRATLQLGSNILGGRGSDAVVLSAIVSLPPTAVLVVRPDALSVLRRLAPETPIRVDGHPVGANPVELRHGSRIDIGNCQLTYGHPSPLRAGPGADPTSLGTELMPSVSDRKSGYRLVETASGNAIEIPENGAVLGRDRACDVVMSGKGVSRRHAIIQQAAGSYVLIDQSSNGTLVNGARLAGPHSLRRGDLIAIGPNEFRWEIKGSARPAREPCDGTEMMPSVQLAGRAPLAEGTLSEPPERASVQPLESPATLATLSNGLLWRTEFRINRPVAAIGRGEHNDVRIVDESVSASHATLIRKGEAWFVLDLGSSNGTFVDGLRVAGERAVPPGAILTLGNVKLTLRPRIAKNGAGLRTQPVRRGELFSRLARLIGRKL